MLTGSLPYEHGVHTENHSFSGIAPEETFLAELDGYHSIGITQHGLLDEKNDFNKFFDEYLQPATVSNDISPEMEGKKKYVLFLLKCLKSDYPIQNIDDLLWLKFNSLMRSLSIPKLTDDGATALAETATRKMSEQSEPTFMLINFFDVHHPYRTNRQYKRNYSVPNGWEDEKPAVWEYNESDQADEKYTEYYRKMYRASTEYTDKVISDMISDIEDVTERETVFIITSDHGHNLGYKPDDYMFGHNSTMSEGVLHTPLDIVNAPAEWPAFENRLFSHCDLGELIVQLSKNQELTSDLFPEYIRSEVVGRPSGYEDLDRFPGSEKEFSYWNRMIRCVYRNETKYQWDTKNNREKYEIDFNKMSWQKLVAEDVDIPEVCYEQFDIDINTYKDSVERGTTDEITKSRLKDLGYL
jgi:hypothetical protein